MNWRLRRFAKIWQFLYVPLAIYLLFLLAVFLLENESLRRLPVVGRFAVFSEVRGFHKALDIFYFPYKFKSRQLPVLELSIAKNSINDLNQAAQAAIESDFLLDELKNAVPATLTFQDKEYPADIRYRGDGDIHWKYAKKSWRVRLSKNDYIFGMNNFDLIIPEDRGYVLEHLNSYRAAKFGLVGLRSQFVDLKINGSMAGVYFLIDHNYSQSLEVAKKPGDVNTYGGYVRDRPQWEDTDHVGMWRKYSNDKISAIDNYAEMNQLLKILKETNDEEFKQKIPLLVDLNGIYGWQIIAELSGSDHVGFGNSRLYFDSTKGKFSVITWDIEGGKAPDDYAANLLISRILNIPEFFQAKETLLWNYVQNEKNLADDLAYYDEWYGKIKNSLYRDENKHVSSLEAEEEIKHWREVLIARFAGKKARLSQDQVNLVVNQAGVGRNIVRLDLTLLTHNNLVLKNIFLNVADLNNANLGLLFDANANYVLDSDDKNLGIFGLYDSGYRIQTSQELMVQRNYPSDYRTFSGQAAAIESGVYSFFVTGLPNSILNSENLNCKIVNDLTGEAARINLFFPQESAAIIF